MRLTIGIVLLSFALGAGPVHASNAPDPRQRVEATANQLFAITDSGTPDDPANQAQVEAKAQQILGEIVDYAAIARGVYGKTYRGMVSEDQNLRFQKEFERSIVQLLAKALMDMGPSETVVHEASMRGDTRAQIPVVVTTSHRETFEFQFSLALAQQVWQVRNLIVNGVNLGLTYRNQFSELMKTHGDNIDAVIDAWSDSMVEAGPPQK